MHFPFRKKSKVENGKTADRSMKLMSELLLGAVVEEQNMYCTYLEWSRRKARRRRGDAGGNTVE
jgi:hypothetical protein